MPYLLILLLFSAFSWGNPFSPFVIPRSGPSPFFHEIKRPFIYPFEQSDKVISGILDVQKMEKEFGSDVLNKVEQIYRKFDFDPKTSGYAYPFPIHPEWEILPYPYADNRADFDPTKWIAEFRIQLDVDEGIRSYKFQEELNSLTESEAYTGNSLKLLRTPDNMEMVYQQLEKARDHVLISSFLFQCDLGMGKFLGILEQKIKEGVDVYLIYDQKFSLTDPKCKKQLKRLGVKVALHHGGGPFQVFHEKMMVFDGKYGMVLGQNMLASQVLSTGTNNLINDVAIGVEGPMVGVIAERFLHLWKNELKKEMSPSLLNFYQNLKQENQKYSRPEKIKEALSSGAGVCRLVSQTPGKKNISNLYFKIVEETRSYLFFNMIDVSFRKLDGKKINERFLRKVVDKLNTNRELRVDMLTNNWKLPTDVETSNGQGVSANLFSKLSIALGRIVTRRPHREIPRTLDSLRSIINSDNFHWWSYSQYMHGKTLMSDNIFSIIGSYNINATSELNSYELVMACLDTELAQEFQKSIVLDNLNSIPLEI